MFLRRVARGSNGRSAELVGVAQPIVRCGEVGSIGRRREVSERRVLARGVEVRDPCRHLGAGVVEIEEHTLGAIAACSDPCDVLQMRVESGPKEGPDHEAIEVQRGADHRRVA